MTKDLEETLAELGPGYREVVMRLKAAYCPLTDESAADRHTGRMLGWTAGYLVAASLLVVFALPFLFREPVVRGSEAKIAYTVAYQQTEDAVRQIVASQRGDGSWANDFLTCQNAAALRGAEGAAIRIAYKKALRYLRARGLRPLSDAELKSRGDMAAKRVS